MSPNPDACEEELPFSEGDTIKVLMLCHSCVLFNHHSHLMFVIIEIILIQFKLNVLK